jgi:hypothetical protein
MPGAWASLQGVGTLFLGGCSAPFSGITAHDFFREINVNSLTPNFRTCNIINEQNQAPVDSSPSEAKKIARILPTPISIGDRA